MIGICFLISEGKKNKSKIDFWIFAGGVNSEVLEFPLD